MPNLKARGLNPGSSADLTVASLFALCLRGHAQALAAYNPRPILREAFP